MILQGDDEATATNRDALMSISSFKLQSKLTFRVSVGSLNGNVVALKRIAENAGADLFQKFIRISLSLNVVLFLFPNLPNLRLDLPFFQY